MSHSFLSRPAVQRFLAAPGPFVLYSVLTGLSLYGAGTSGSVVGLWFALFFGGIVAEEVRYLVTGRWHPGP